MKYLFVVLFSLVFFPCTVHAQDYRQHKVEKGETVTDVAKKYKVTPHDIYRLNPDSKKGLKENTVLIIPSKSLAKATQDLPKEQPTKLANTIHEVKPKETFYSLSKKYNVTEADIKKANGELLADGLKIGQQIIIPIKGDPVDAQVKAAEKQKEKKKEPVYVYHVVKQGETKYSIARQYGITLQVLEELNPEVVDVLPLGYNLKLISNDAVIESRLEDNDVQPGYTMYTVQPKETFYSLTRQTGLTQEKIIELNPEAKDGLKEGMVLRLPAQGTAVSGNVVPSKFTDLTKTLKRSSSKEIVLLLPFNMARVEADTSRSRQEFLRTDKFLNMTLDFYAGALIAIDSAKTLGLPLRVKIFDSNETRNTSDIASLRSRMLGANAVIGPFFPSNAETAAMSLDTVPVISPLSRDYEKAYKNLFISVPSQDKEREAMMNYLMGKGGNVIAIVDAKKNSTRRYIRDNYPSVRILDGAVNEASLKNLLQRDVQNYVILETESAEMLLNTTKELRNAQNNYNIQLAVLEKTDKLDHDEAIKRLISLKMLYPSVNKEGESLEGSAFYRKFREKNGVNPNQYAVRGFDVTFDVIVRLFQQESFRSVMNNTTSQQVENKFMYQSSGNGNFNTGVYILYYDDDLTVKLAQ